MKATGKRNGQYKHGKSGFRIYNIWCKMKNRILCKTNDRYYRYGGRGITIDEGWLTFTPFYNWAIKHGYNDTLTIDRKDNEKGYSPSNCRWRTKKQNSQNRSTLAMSGIRKHGAGFQVRAKNTNKCLGTFPTLKEAKKVRNENIKTML